ncbi:HlyD family efflux transporter periplasmic adaptor subunit [Paenibacillus filicis]|uniref:HlyD family efflux transporter periplasmic adaptor subunit n=1 Tax=Paenibacillus gyeongsangnamensis TaxID=3388067 RepID=A0ABT4QCS4_9BACL|nr:biotin/lipoyl-binding protein [Paenibacillus filicis]MCZ8514683.1 HlyD family efflux transporter periplasmic adaptor subunit [Paenibacillus filicis]
MKKQLIAVLVLAAAVGSGGWMLAADGKDAVTLAAGNKGSILTAEQVNVSFQGVAGKVIDLPVREEQPVKKGDVLMTLDPTDLDLQLKKAQADIEVTSLKIKQAEDAVQVAQSKLDNAVKQAELGLSQAETQAAQVAEGARQEDIQRQKLAVAGAEEAYTHALKLYNQLLNTEETYDKNPYSYKDHRDAVENARSQVAALQNARDQQQAALDKMLSGATDKERKQAALQTDRAAAAVEQQQLAQGDIDNQKIGIDALNKQLEQQNILLQSLQIQKDRLTLRAPADGKVAKVIPKAGENVGSGAPVIVLETGKLYYDLYVDERQVSKFKVNGTVPTHFAALPDQVEGRIQFVTAAPQFAALRMSREKGTADLNTFQIRVYVDKTDKLLPGMTAEVHVDEVAAK